MKPVNPCVVLVSDNRVGVLVARLGLLGVIHFEGQGIDEAHAIEDLSFHLTLTDENGQRHDIYRFI